MSGPMGTKYTRANKAFDLLQRAKTGPQGGLGFPHPANAVTTWGEADKKAKDSYRMWSETWLLPLIQELVPELRGSQKVDEILARLAKAQR